MKKMKRKYIVGFDMKYSHSYVVPANNITEARNKAFTRFKATRNRISQYNVDVDKE